MTRPARPDAVRYRIGATKLRIDPSEYRQQREAGQRWCAHDKRWEAADRFGPNRTRAGGVAGSCRESLREYARVNMVRLRAERLVG